MLNWLKKEKIPLIIIAFCLVAIAVIVVGFGKPLYESALSAGKVAMAKGDFVGAEAQFGRATLLWPFSGEARGNLGIAYKRQLKDGQAISELTLATFLFYDTKEVRLNRAIAYFLNGNFAAAKKDLQAALKKDSAYPLANYWMARALLEQGSSQEALPYAEKAASDQRLSGILDQLKSPRP